MGTLQVRIIRCFNIKSISITGNVDPYVIITTGHEYSWNKHNSKTRIVYKNKNPVWDQSFAFKVKDTRLDVVQMTLWDHNAVDSNKMIGAATYPLSTLPQGQEIIIQQLPIRRGKKTKAYIDIGLTAINFGTITQVTTTSMVAVLPQPTITQQPIYLPPQPQPIQTVVSMPAQPLIQPQQTTTVVSVPYQPSIISYPNQPYLPAQGNPMNIEYNSSVPLIDDNAFFAYSNMLYGNGSMNMNTYTPDQVIQVTAPPGQIQNIPNM